MAITLLEMVEYYEQQQKQDRELLARFQATIEALGRYEKHVAETRRSYQELLEIWQARQERIDAEHEILESGVCPQCQRQLPSVKLSA